MKPATRRQFLGLAAVGLEYMTKGCAPFYQMPVIPELKVTNKLFEHPITYATRKEGEKKLRPLTITQNLEDEWLFFDVKEPSLDFWIDIANFQTESMCLSSFSAILSIVEEKSEEYGYKIPITEYHIHPKKAIEKILRNRNKIDGCTINKTNFEICSFPSYGDVVSLINTDKMLKTKGYKLEKPSCIVTPHAVIRYMPNESFISRYKELGKKYAKNYFKGITRKIRYNATRLSDLDIAIMSYKNLAGIEIGYERFSEPLIACS